MAIETSKAFCGRKKQNGLKRALVEKYLVNPASYASQPG